MYTIQYLILFAGFAFELIDQQAANAECKAGTFDCQNTLTINGVRTAECIPAAFKCDGNYDCTNQFDEQNCENIEPIYICPKDSFVCHDKELCIRKEFTCDEERDCFDGSDEIKCDAKCDKDEGFACLSHDQCGCHDDVCDGIKDCMDKSDEICDFKCSDENMFQCRTRSHCVCNSLECDGKRDCTDGSDEQGCDNADDTCRAPRSKRCVPAELPCDHWQDCNDGVDEHKCKLYANCNVHTGGLLSNCSGMAACMSYGDVQVWKCDGESDCLDGSDEQCTVCDKHNTKCLKDGNSQCVPHCDGWLDCRDGLDESNCDNPLPCTYNPQHHWFVCENDISCQTFVNNAWKCDKEIDCEDRSDENPNVC